MLNKQLCENSKVDTLCEWWSVLLYPYRHGASWWLSFNTANPTIAWSGV